MMRVIDLTFPIQNGMLTFGSHWHPKVVVEQLGRIEVEGRETRKLVLGTHTGTHIDAPLHFIRQGKTIDEIPLDLLIGPVTIKDLSHVGRDGVVTLEIVRSWTITPRMLIRFDWSKYWGDRQKYYFGYPYFTEEAAMHLVERGVRYLGYDIPSPDDSNRKLDGSHTDSPIHKIFLGNGVWLNEYVANLEQVDELEGWNVAALPLKISGADGSPARVVLWRPKHEPS